MYADTPAPELECALCLEPVPEQPHCLKNNACDHFFCKKCLLLALERRKTCPVCRKPTTLPDRPNAPVDDLLARSRLAFAMTDALRVHCPAGCKEDRTQMTDARSLPTWSIEKNRCQTIVKKNELVLKVEIDFELKLFCS